LCTGLNNASRKQLLLQTLLEKVNKRRVCVAVAKLPPGAASKWRLIWHASLVLLLRRQRAGMLVVHRRA
jgi:hypothetical protein